MFVDKNPHSHKLILETTTIRSYVCCTYVRVMPWTYLTVYTHIPPPTHIPTGPPPPTHTHTQNNKCETNLQIKSVSFVSESGNSCVSSGGRSEGVLRILEPKTIAKEIKLIELIGMPYICCVQFFPFLRPPKNTIMYTYTTLMSPLSLIGQQL